MGQMKYLEILLNLVIWFLLIKGATFPMKYLLNSPACNILFYFWVLWADRNYILKMEMEV